MLITILAAGSRGDTQPYLALGAALKKTGQAVRFATFENYADAVKSSGLELFPIPGDVTKVVASASAQGALQADNPLKVLLSFNTLKKLAAGLQQAFYDACAGADAVVYHPGAAVGYFAAQRMGIPSILALPFPMVPTRAYPSLIFYDKPRLGQQYNLATHKIMRQIMWFASDAGVRDFWKKSFGQIPPDFGCPYPKQVTRRTPTIISCSEAVFPRPADWPEHVVNTGYWFTDDEPGWQPSADLSAFLQNGQPPVYVGFGSVSNAGQAEQTTRLVIEALQRSGQRGILATGWNGMTRIDSLPENIFMLESAPHTWLFPRMAAVVHHGGAATTAAGFQAGVPSVVIPHSNDQFAWGLRVYELGVGAKPIPRKKLNAENLSAAIQAALTEPVKAAARELGSKIQGENGAETGARIILDSLMQSSEE